MKKILSACLCLLLAFSLCACGERAGSSPVPGAAPLTAAPTETAEPPLVTQTPAPTATPEPLPLVPELPPVHDAALNAVLSESLDVWPGTAGSSLRAARCAAHLLDWGAVTQLTDDEIYSAVGCYLDTLDDADLVVFLESILPVYDASYNLRGEYAEGIMEDAGVTDSLYPWNERAFRAVEMVSLACSVR